MPKSAKAKRNINLTELFCVSALLLALNLTGLGTRWFSTRGEAREALVAQSMEQGGSWVLGSGYGGDVPSKPPLLHWLIATSANLVGEPVSELSARLPSALAASLFCLLFFIFLCRRTDKRLAYLTVGVLALSAEWLRAAGACRVDMCLAVFMAGGLLVYLSWKEQREIGLLWLVGACLGAAVLSKGPVGALLPLVIITLDQLADRRSLPYIASRGLVILGVALLVSGWWYWAAMEAGGDRFFDKVFYENFSRLSSSMDDEPHKHSLFYLLGTIPIGLLPWSLLLLALLPEAVWRRDFSIRGMSERFNKAEAFTRFALMASLVIITFFCIPSSKRSVYLLPAYPFFAYLTAKLLLQIEARKPYLWRIFAISLASLSLLIVLILVSGRGLAAIWPSSSASNDFVANALANFPGSLSFFSVLLLLVPVIAALLVLLEVRRPRWKKSVLLLSGIQLFSLLWSLNAVIVGGFTNQLSVRPEMEAIEAAVRDSPRLYSFRYEFYAASFYLKRRIDRLTSAPPPGSTVFLMERDLAEFEHQYGTAGRRIFRSSSSIERPGARLMLIKIS
ncbi:MAG: glycosyltransferase family 39 protein [Oligoflexia bacterium]|nr:glycosyltransferase family 39 protein [Oligoflexia bacterium]